MNILDEFTERVIDWQERMPWPVEYTGIVVAAITELAAGEAVDLARIARRAGAPADEVLDFLRGTPAEFDPAGRLVGFGVTLRPTPHRVELDGRTLYTWCGPDTLELPIMLGKPARIESPCFATGEPVRIEVDPDGVRMVEPDEAVVSIMLADTCMSDFRQQVCDEQHFFSSIAAAADWHADRPEAIVVPIRSGFALTQMMMTRWFGTEGHGDRFDRALEELPSCALDEPGRRAQRARYTSLAPHVIRVQRQPEAVVIDFDQDLDFRLLDDALAVERACCPFLAFEFDRQPRRLRATVTDPTMRPALDAIANGFERS